MSTMFHSPTCWCCGRGSLAEPPVLLAWHEDVRDYECTDCTKTLTSHLRRIAAQAQACTEKEHRFNGGQPTCACGTTTRPKALWVDDVKPAPEGIEAVTSYHEALDRLLAGGIDHLYLDFDLGHVSWTGAKITGISASWIGNHQIGETVDELRARGGRS